MKNKPALIFAIIVAVLSLAAQPLLAIVNPPFGTGGSGNDNKKCQGESKGGEEESYHSFDWSLDLGKVRFSTPKSYMTYARLGVAEGSRRGALPRSLDQVVKFYQGGGYMNRKMLKLDLSSPEINASLRNPESFTYDQSTSAEIIELDGFVNQIRTDDAITHVDKFPGGFTIRMWNLEDFHLQAKENNLYPVPDIASDTTFLAKITFRKPTPESGDNELLITSVQRFGETFKKTTRHLVESELAQYDLREPGADGPQSSQSDPFKTLTVKTYDGEDTTGRLVKIEKLYYSHKGDKVWDYHIERKVWQAKTIAHPRQNGTIVTPTLISPQQTDAFLTLHDYEEYKDFSTSPAGGGKGARRLVRKVAGYGTDEATETQYEFWDTPNNPYTHGRLKSVVRPDGTWEYHQYLDAQYASTVKETKYSSWKDVPMENRAYARVETTLVEAGKITRTLRIAGVDISKTVTTRGVGADSSITRVVTQDKNGNTLRATETARHGEGAAAYLAGRPKWEKHADGTITTYSYAYNASTGETTVTVRRGAGTVDGGVTSGTQTVKVLNPNQVVTSETVSSIAPGSGTLPVSTWYVSMLDNRDRYLAVVYGDGTRVTSTYGCCGLTSRTDRTGAITQYRKDPLRRTYFVSRRRSSGGTPVDTLTSYDGLTTTTERTDGTTTLLVNRTTRSLGGLTTTTVAPSNTSLSPADRVVTRSVTIPATRTTTRSYQIGDSWNASAPSTLLSETVNFLDGSTKSATDAEGHTTHYDKGTHTLQGGGLWSSTTAPNGTQWVKTFTDQLGRTIRTEYPGNAVAKMLYNGPHAAQGACGKLAVSVDPDWDAAAGKGVSVTYGYNAEGKRTTTSTSTPGGASVTTVTTSVVGNAVSGIGTAYRTVTTVHGAGTHPVPPVVTSTTYRSTDGYSSKTVTPSGTVTSVRTVPADGSWIVTSTTADGQTTVQTYTDGLPVKTETFDNRGTAPANLLTSATYTYDTFGRRLTTTDSRTGVTTVNGYNESGTPTSVTSNNGQDTTSYTYDPFGRRIKTTLPDNSETHTSYTPAGRIRATWGSQTYPRFYEYDALGRMTALHTWQTAPALTQDTTAAPSGSSVTTWSYDPQRGFLIEKNYHGETGNGPGNTADYTYTPAGRLATRTWERGITTTYTYNHGSLASVVHTNDPTHTPNVTYTHDTLGRPTSVVQTRNGTGTRPLASFTYTYDAANLALASETVSYDTNADGTADFTRVIDRYKDALLRPLSIEIPGEYTSGYAYDTAGRPASVWHQPTLDPGTHAPAGTAGFTYAYEPGSPGLIKSVTGPTHTVTNTYEPHRNILTGKENSVSSVPSVVSNYAYTTNAIGQRTALVTGGTAFGTTAPAYQWSYNTAGELVSADDTTGTANDRAYLFDAIGNRQSAASGTLDPNAPGATTYTANALNQYTAIGSLNPVHDADGNMTSDPLPVDPAANAALVWDAENRLVAVTRVDNTVIRYAYDHTGRRFSRQVGNSATTHYIYDKWNPIAEYTGTTLAKTYTWGTDLSGSMQGAGGVGGLLAVNIHTGANAGTYFPTYDGNGNVSEYLGSNGTVAAHYEYDAFGNLTKQTGAMADTFAHRFSTKPLDPGTGLYNYGYRPYNPLTGRFPSRDPIGEKGGIYLYGFVGNGSVNQIDVLGLNPCTDCEGKFSKSIDCEWTGKKKPNRTTGINHTTIYNHKIDRKKYPDHAKVHWDNICKSPRKLVKFRNHTNPSGGPPSISGNSATMSIQSRYFAKEFLRGNYSWVWAGARKRAKSESSADFCCCKPMKK